jgi:hypothetical protein
MNINQLKPNMASAISAVLGKPYSLPEINLYTQVDKDTQVQTEFLSHWDDIERVRITMHQDILAKIKADPTFSGLAFKKPEVVTPQAGAKSEKTYLHVIVITPNNIAATL